MTAGRELGIMVSTPLVLGVPTVYAPIPVARRIPGRCAGSTRSRACPTLVLAPGQALVVTGSVYTVTSGLSVSVLSLNHEAAAVNEFLSYHLSRPRVMFLTSADNASGKNHDQCFATEYSTR